MLDGKEDVAYDTIAKYIEKFTPKVLIKNLIVLINRAEEYDHTIEQFFQVFKDYLEQEYADESMRAYIRGQVTTIPQVHIATIDEEGIHSCVPDKQYSRLISLIRKKGASKYFVEWSSATFPSKWTNTVAKSKLKTF